MIFVGSGSLLSHAVTYAKGAGLTISTVCCPTGDSSLPRLTRLGIDILESDNPSSDILNVICRHQTDPVFSINNKYILDDTLLASGPDFFNIHNGLVQRYRGRAEICIFAAVCAGESHYGATLHKLLPGQKVDAGPVVAQASSDLDLNDDFATVMRRSLRLCQDVFEQNVRSVVSGNHSADYVGLTGSAFTYRDVDRIASAAEPVRLALASRLGAYRAFFPKLAKALERFYPPLSPP